MLIFLMQSLPCLAFPALNSFCRASLVEGKTELQIQIQIHKLTKST
jgi:hypothetical protein